MRLESENYWVKKERCEPAVKPLCQIAAECRERTSGNEQITDLKWRISAMLGKHKQSEHAG